MTADLYTQVRKPFQSEAEGRVSGRFARGGGVHPDKAEDEKLIKRDVTKAVHEHEEHDHPGKEPTKIRVKRGGEVKGTAPKHRLDHRARGGKTGEKEKGKVIINVHSGEQAAQQQGMQQGMKIGAAMGGAKPPMPGGAPQGAMPPHPPMAPPPGAGGPPMGGAPGMPPGGMPPKPPGALKRGGKVKLDAGAGGGQGRIEKARQYGETGEKPETVTVREHQRRKSGGRCD